MAFQFTVGAMFNRFFGFIVCFVIVKFWPKHGKMLDRMTGKIVNVTNRTLASAYVLCHPTLPLSLFQKQGMEISSSIEEEIQETTTREEWDKTKLIFKTGPGQRRYKA